jgi:hypothetical protein
LEKLVDDCGRAFDVDPSGQYRLNFSWPHGLIYEVSVSDKKCITLVENTRAGVEHLPATANRSGTRMLLMVKWRPPVNVGGTQNGKLIGAPAIALKVPISLSGSYDFFT